jgi:hypothetical protein
MKQWIIICIFFPVSIKICGQSTVTFFRLLPPDCTPDLNAKEKNALLRKGTYTIPGGDSIETIQYTIDTTESKNYLRYEYGFTTGQRGFVVFELRKLLRKNGEPLLIFSRYGGAPAAYDQHELRLFSYKSGKLAEINNNLLPKEIDIQDFLETGTPDSIKNKIESYVNITYDLYPNVKNAVSMRLFQQVFLNDYENYLVGTELLFTWDGNTFSRKIISDLE